ncbi:MAG: DUF4105 domain-containing protein [Bacteroidales bacterium]
MKRLKFLLVFIGLMALNASAGSQTLSKNAEISLVTCSPGSELYSIFGHSAIRVNDSTTNTDLIFNYGVFDFSTPNFYWKFIRGKLQYQLAIQPMDRFLEEYRREGRSVKEEKFLLTQQERKQMIKFLRWNYLPENRFYLYDFFYNNCSTKIWDVAKSKVKNELEFDTSVYSPQSFRDLMCPYLETVPWARLGIDILLGLPADNIASFPQQMYLPDYLSRNMSHTFRTSPVNDNERLLGPEHILLEKDPAKSSFDEPVIGPVLAGWVLLLAVVGLTLFARSGSKKWFDGIFLSILGLLGLVLIFMWIATDHQQMKWNLNVLWANPIGLVFTWFVLRNKIYSASWVYGILMIVSILTLVFWNLIPQDFNQALLPVTLAVTVRGADHFIPVCCKSFNLYELKKKIRAMVLG